mmetsp:Transcript_25386/g.45974  ORF Transcript_25386/g.45974 Transcript_25386/m.45974 type:complete len:206 (+) Transcript_25386:95-712(+)
MSQCLSQGHSKSNISHAALSTSSSPPLSFDETAVNKRYRLSSSSRMEYTVSTKDRSRGRITFTQFCPCCMMGSFRETRLVVMSMFVVTTTSSELISPLLSTSSRPSFGRRYSVTAVFSFVVKLASSLMLITLFVESFSFSELLGVFMSLVGASSSLCAKPSFGRKNLSSPFACCVFEFVTFSSFFGGSTAVDFVTDSSFWLFLVF